MIRALFIFFVLSVPLLNADIRPSPFSDPLKDAQGVQRCCLPTVHECLKECTTGPKKPCLANCHKKYCIAFKLSCLEKPKKETPQETASPDPVTSGTPTPSATSRPTPVAEPAEEGADPQVKKLDKKALRHDGVLTGAGTVSFELENADPKERTLRVVGILFATAADGEKIILKKTPLEQVFPSSPTHVVLEVSEDEFNRWKGAHGQIQLGITYPESFDATGWEFENLLEAEDAEKTRGGQFFVKGRFQKKNP